MRRSGLDLLRFSSILLLLGAVALFFVELIAYSRQRARMPEALTIAGVPVGGMDKETAVNRLLKTYSTPVELHYGEQVILLQPSVVGFQPDSEAMLAAAELLRTGTDFWGGFWDFLWNRPGEPRRIPLRSEYSKSQLEAVLRDIAARYDEPASPAQPIPGSATFEPGKPGRLLDIARAVELVGQVLQSSRDRRVNLPIVESSPPHPSLHTLETLLKQNIDLAGFDGLVSVYLQDLRTGEELQFAYYRGDDVEAEPGIAFTAASVIKIGIMVTYFRYFDEPFSEEESRWMAEMITKSQNEPADYLMERLDPVSGPLIVSETMQRLGFESTFLAGKFRLGAELLRVFRTPGNGRTDINTQPDVYDQTTAAEIGQLLADIYACARGGGALIAAFPGEITQDECQHMLDLLAQNKIAVLLEAGVPDGTLVAHKHGWTNSPLDTIGDAGIIYTPGGDYVLSIFLWDDVEMIWDPTSKLVADIGRVVYNFFNPPVASFEAQTF